MLPNQLVNVFFFLSFDLQKWKVHTLVFFLVATIFKVVKSKIKIFLFLIIKVAKFLI